MRKHLHGLQAKFDLSMRHPLSSEKIQGFVREDLEPPEGYRKSFDLFRVISVVHSSSNDEQSCHVYLRRTAVKTSNHHPTAQNSSFHPDFLHAAKPELRAHFEARRPMLRPVRGQSTTCVLRHSTSSREGQQDTVAFFYKGEQSLGEQSFFLRMRIAIKGIAVLRGVSRSTPRMSTITATVCLGCRNIGESNERKQKNQRYTDRQEPTIQNLSICR